jgi:hypothetical protein
MACTPWYGREIDGTALDIEVGMPTPKGVTTASETQGN